jgi:hypothetical protein
MPLLAILSPYTFLSSQMISSACGMSCCVTICLEFKSNLMIIYKSNNDLSMNMLSRNFIEHEIVKCTNELKSLGIYFQSAPEQINKPNTAWAEIRRFVTELLSTSNRLPDKVKSFGELLASSFSDEEKVAFGFLDGQIKSTHFLFNEMHTFIEICNFKDANSCVETKRRLGINADAAFHTYSGLSRFISKLKESMAELSEINTINPSDDINALARATDHAFGDVGDANREYWKRVDAAKKVMVDIESGVALILWYSRKLKTSPIDD